MLFSMGREGMYGGGWSPISHTCCVLGVLCVCTRRRIRNFINLILSKTTNEIIYLSVDNTVCSLPMFL